MDLKHIAHEVCRIARATGGYLRAERLGFANEHIIEKGTHDYVSYVDRGAERITVDALGALLPGAGFVTEEGTVEQSATGLNWVVDPLDGTTNFIHDNAPYCVSIALRQDREVLVGVVYEVCRDECYWAWKGGGAWLNGSPIRVSGNPLERSLICLELPYEVEKYKPVILSLVNDLFGRVSGIRMNGSSAMSLCYVAAGRFEAWAEAYIKPWDYMAGILIVREAGGTVTNFRGGSEISGPNDIVATNGTVHGEMLAVFDRQKVKFD